MIPSPMQNLANLVDSELKGSFRSLGTKTSEVIEHHLVNHQSIHPFKMRD